MASAAAVAADASRSPLPDHEVNEELGTVGTITSADPPLATHNSDNDDDEDDDDIRPKNSRRKIRTTAIFDDDEEDEVQAKGDDGDRSMVDATNNNTDGDGEDDAGGLFGSEDDDSDGLNETKSSRRARQLDDEDLDSGDDEERDDRRMEEDDMEGTEVHEKHQTSLFEVDLARQPIPEPTDGELYLMKLPQFLTISPEEFQAQQVLQSAESNQQNGRGQRAQAKHASLHSYNSAMTTALWRRSPSDPSQLQSTSRIVRWSDGSLTLQFASNPSNHYPIIGNALAPPQPNPKKPTPVSNSETKRKATKNAGYNSDLDSFTYLTLGQSTSFVLRVTNKFTATLKVQSAAEISGEALERLQNSLAVAGNVNGNTEGSGMNVIKLTEDPEKAKKRVEEAEKEKLKAQRRREAQEARDRERHGRVLGVRRGPGFGAGLTVGGLEDDDELGMGVTRPPGSASKKRKAPPRGRRGEIYSDDEDGYGARGRTREDEYDIDDGFLAPSDEEEPASGSSSDVDDGIVEPPRSSVRRQEAIPSGRRVTPEGDIDAEGDPDDDTAPSQGLSGSPLGRTKRRRVIEEDEDEE